MLKPIIAVAKKEYLTLIRYPLSLVFNLFSTFFSFIPLLITAKLFGAKGHYLWLAIGSISWMWLSQIIWTVGLALRNEQQQGTISEILISPVSLFSIMLGKSVIPLINNILILIIGSVVLVKVFHVSPNWIMVAAVFIVTIPIMYGIAFILSGLVINFGEVFALLQVIMLLLVILCGVSQPPEVLPNFLSSVGNFIPITWAIQLLRDIIIDSVGWDYVLPIIGGLVLSGIVLNTLAVACFKMLLKRASVTGRGLCGY